MPDDRFDVKMYDPRSFVDEDYAKQYALSFDKYAELRVQGKSREMATMEAFELIKYNVDSSNLSQLALAAELNPYVQRRMKQLLNSKDVKRDLWSERMAVQKLLEIIQDPMSKDSTRLNAVNALNVLCGYITLDEQTARRVGHTLADFAKLDAASAPEAAKGGDGAKGAGNTVH